MQAEENLPASIKPIYVPISFNRPEQSIGTGIILFKHYMIFLRGGNGPPYRIFHTFNLNTFELKSGSLKGDIDSLPYEIYGRSLCLFGEDTILALGPKNNSRSTDFFWLTVEEDSAQQTLSIASETLPIEQDNRVTFTRILAAFVNEQSYYILGVENKLSENLFEFNLNRQDWNRVPMKSDGLSIFIRGAQACYFENGTLYMIMGASSDLWKLDIRNLTWTKILPKSGKVPKLGSCVLQGYEGKLYIYGRDNERGSSLLFYEYDLARDVWSEVYFKNSLIPQINQHGCVKYMDSLFIANWDSNSCKVHQIIMGMQKKTVCERPKFPEFFLSKDLADVIFKVEGREFYCHKLILSKASQYFFKMFTSNGI